MAYLPIEEYGIIGNMRTVALVDMNGSIDWYCYPHFDSPSIFGAILDDKKGGRFHICAVGELRELLFIEMFIKAFPSRSHSDLYPR